METILLYIVFFSINISLINFCKIVSAPVSGGCHNAIGGQGQLGCMRPVCHRSSSELQINVCTMLKDAATLSWPGLVNQVLPSRDSCWLASAKWCGRKFEPCQGQNSATDKWPAQDLQQKWSS